MNKNVKYCIYCTCFVFLGFSIGMIVAFSDSPVISSVVSILLSLMVTITALASGIRDIRLFPFLHKGTVEITDANAKIKLGESFSPVFLTFLTVGLLAGSLLGIYAKNNVRIFELDLNKIVERWYNVCKLSEEQITQIQLLNATQNIDLDHKDSIQHLKYELVIRRHQKTDSIELLKQNILLRQAIAITLFKQYYQVGNGTDQSTHKYFSGLTISKGFKNDLLKEEGDDGGESTSNESHSNKQNKEFPKTMLSQSLNPQIERLKSNTDDEELNLTLYDLASSPDYFNMRYRANKSNIKLVKKLNKEVANDTLLKKIYKTLWQEM